MSDAEVIPIGTRGRPGRGSGAGKTTASSAARGLAGSSGSSAASPKKTAKTAKTAPKKGATASTKTATASTKTAVAQAKKTGPKKAASTKAAPKKPAPKKPAGEDVTEAATSAGTDTIDVLDLSARTRATALSTSTRATALSTSTCATATDRDPTGGVPLGDWIAAITSAAQQTFGIEDWERKLAEFLSFLRSRLTGDYEIDAYGFDRELTERFFLAALRPIYTTWFRVEVRGAENLPATGGALVVSNHSGTVPVDGLMTQLAVHESSGRHLRPLGADLVFRLPVVSTVGRRVGATLACHEDAERMLRDGELVGVWPEGFKGIGKPYRERYKLQRFGRGGFVSAALRTGVPIVPLSVVGAEEIYPLVGNLPALARVLGLPYIPITPFLPALGPLGLIPLPSKWLMEFGEPIRTDEYDSTAADDPMLVFNVTDEVRETIQQTLYSLLMQRSSVFF